MTQQVYHATGGASRMRGVDEATGVAATQLGATFGGYAGRRSGAPEEGPSIERKWVGGRSTPRGNAPPPARRRGRYTSGCGVVLG